MVRFFAIMERYSIIENKNKREIVLLKGRGCIYKKCTFCDYYTDSSPDEESNFLINKEALDRVQGLYQNIEIINSGSIFELDYKTLDYIKETCDRKNIKTIHFEAHYLYKDRIEELRNYFSDFDLKLKLGLETFDYDFRESVLNKGINESSPEIISKHFDEANFLFGIDGQTYQSMKNDIELGLKYFERICINIMNNNSTGIKPCKRVIDEFINNIYPAIADDDRIDILINNTDFGVGD